MSDEEIFAKAIELHVQKRAAFLDGFFLGQPDRRAKIEAMIRAHEQSDSLFDAAPYASTAEKTSSHLQQLEQIGNYKLLQKIGEGGFGIVYMAEQVCPVKRKVALKVIKPGMDSEAVVARFEAERQALAMMDHANIARVFDGGLTEQGRPYFVMELVKGVPITIYCDDNKLRNSDRLKLFIDVCSAVQHAHQKGIIHRDIKPSNVMVTLHDGEPVVKVIDFGVAKAMNTELTEKTLFTAYGQMIGTPQYMSPEQAEMSGLDIDTRSDVYSLGVLLYELLTGTTPLEAEPLRAAGYVGMQKMIKETEPPRPSVRLSSAGEKLTHIAAHRSVAPDKLRREVKGDLDWIVMKALEKDRNRRFDTAKGLVLDVERYLKSEPVSARSPSAGYVLCKLLYRYRHTAAVVGSFILLLLCTIVLLAHFYALERESRGNAVEAKKVADAAKRQAENSAKIYRRGQYAADMNLAAQAFYDNDIFRVEEILEEYRKAPDLGELRDFAYDWLSRSLAEIENANVIPVSNGVQDIKFSRDGGVMAVGLQDNTCEIFKRISDTGFEYAGYFGEKFDYLWVPNCIEVSPNGNWVLTASDDCLGLVQIDLLSGISRELLRGEQTLTCLCISRSGNTAVVAFVDRLCVLDLDSSEVIASYTNPNERITAAAMSPDGEWVVWGTREGLLRSTNFASATRADKFELGPLNLEVDRGAHGVIHAVLFSPDGRQIVVGIEDGTVRVFSAPGLVQQRQIIAHEEAIRATCFSSDASLLATSSRDNVVRVWQWPELSLVTEFRGHGGSVNSLQFDPANGVLVSGSLDGTIRFWPVAQQHERDELILDNEVLCLEAMTNTDGFFVGTEEAIYSWEIPTGEKRELSIDTVSALRINSNGRAIFRNSNQQIIVRDLARNDTIFSFPANGVQIPLAISPSGRFAILGEIGEKAVFKELESTKAALNLPIDLVNFHWTTRCGAFNSAETLVALPNSRYEVEIYSTETGTLLGTLRGHRQGVVDVAFGPDGSELVATCSWDNTIRLWSVRNCLELAVMRHAQWLASIAFSPDGKLLASVGGDQKLKLWEVPSGRQLISIATGYSHPRDVVFSENGTTIAVSQEGKQARDLGGAVKLFKGYSVEAKNHVKNGMPPSNDLTHDR